MDSQLTRLQETQHEILMMVDTVCRANDIHYSLYAGTLLGAIRHKGFIPWDDDLDICMSRKEYERFLTVWDKTDHPGYLMQNKENTPEFTQHFTKIRKDHTTFWQSGEPTNMYHIGIFVDIFPIDRMPNGKIRRLIFATQCILYQIFTHQYLPTNGNAVEKMITKIILCLTPKSLRGFFRKKLEKRILRWNDDNTRNMVTISTKKSCTVALPSDILDDFTEVEFCGKMYMSVTKWDELLTIQYGDYMKLPPERDRIWKHQPLIIDFDHNYDEIKQ